MAQNQKECSGSIGYGLSMLVDLMAKKHVAWKIWIVPMTPIQMAHNQKEDSGISIVFLGITNGTARCAMALGSNGRIDR